MLRGGEVADQHNVAVAGDRRPQQFSGRAGWTVTKRFARQHAGTSFRSEARMVLGPRIKKDFVDVAFDFHHPVHCHQRAGDVNHDIEGEQRQVL